MRCSHCGTEVVDTGGVATCPRCTRPVFPSPAVVSGSVLPAAPPPVAGPVIFVAGHPPHRRLEAGGWFSRAFGAAGGVLLAMVLVMALAMLTGFGVLFGGCEMFKASVADLREKRDAETASLTAEAKRFALPHLRKKGIAQLADDAYAKRDGSEVVLFSRARNTDGNVRTVLVTWEVGTFSGTQQWQMKAINIDGEITLFK